MTTPIRAVPLAALLLALSGPSWAQNPCPGHVSANAFSPVPRNAAIAISGRADTQNERMLSEAIGNALRRAGHTVSDSAPYLMSWRGGISRDGLGGGRGGADMFSGSAFHDSDDLHWMQDAPRMRRRGQSTVPPARLSGLVELRERESRRVVWTAVISCQPQGSDQAALFGSLAAAVAPLIGQSASARPF